MDTGDSPRGIVVMGSGETSPTMVGVHRDLVARLGTALHTAVLLETPYGFQENAGEISTRTQNYFARSVGLDVQVPPGLRGSAEADTDRGLAVLRTADWIFAGPGSPSYALTHWRGTAIGDALRDHARTGGAAIVFASAAACTLGMRALPVYEIYKVGASPHWLAGLDLLGCYGVQAAVIPHYDNTEGRNHDTRYCYLGERRLSAIEHDLPDDAVVLGVDEHTAAIIDPATDQVEVRGHGSVTIRRQGASTTVPAGEAMSLAELRSLCRGENGRGSPRPAAAGAETTPPAPDEPPTTLRDVVLDCERRFDAGADAGDASAMVQAILDLDTAVAEWAADMEEDDGPEWGRGVLRTLVVRLGEIAVRGLRDPRDALDPAVQPLLGVRTELRDQRRYDLADTIRDALTAAGIEVRDSPEGTRWHLARDPQRCSEESFPPDAP